MAAAEMLKLEVATPLGLVLETECESVSAPSVDGEFGVLPGHLPLLAALHSGVLEYHLDGERRMAAVGHGFVEAGPERVLLLTERFTLPEDVDAEGTRADLEAAEARLAELEGEYASTDYEEAAREVEWAQAKLLLLEDPRS